jgi:hypothetical protein
MLNSFSRSGVTPLPGERTLWKGASGRGLLFTGSDLFLVPFSLLWCGFAVFWTFGATFTGAPDFFTLWGLMFVAIGLYFVFGRFLVDIWIRRSTTYTVTDRRIFVERGGMFPKLTVLSLAELPSISIKARPSGRGSIRFGEEMSMMGRGNGGGIWSPSLDPTPQFLAIDNVERVFHLIQKAQDDLIKVRRFVE